MNRSELASKIDATIVHNNHTLADVDHLIECAKKYKFASTFMLPCYMEKVAEALKGTDVHTGGVTGFPSGGDFTDAKIYAAKLSVERGAQEIDMAINIGWLLSGLDNKVADDIKAVKDVLGENIPLKCIIESPMLSEDDIRRASNLVVKAGADYVKTATGWFGTTTLKDVEIIKSEIGDSALIKAAGGIRSAEDAMAMITAGASRLGIGVDNAVKILDSVIE